MNRRLPPTVFRAGYIHAVNKTDGRLALPSICGKWKGRGPAGVDEWVGPLTRDGLDVVTGTVDLPAGSSHRDEEYRWADRVYQVGTWLVRYKGSERRLLKGPTVLVISEGHPEDAYRARGVVEDWAPVLGELRSADVVDMAAWQDVESRV